MIHHGEMYTSRDSYPEYGTGVSVTVITYIPQISTRQFILPTRILNQIYVLFMIPILLCYTPAAYVRKRCT